MRRRLILNTAYGEQRAESPKAMLNPKQVTCLAIHRALAKVFRAKLLAAIVEGGLLLPRKYPAKWVVDCKSAGPGEKALVYLGRYLYRGVIHGERGKRQVARWMRCDYVKQCVVCRYRRSLTRFMSVISVELVIRYHS